MRTPFILAAALAAALSMPSLAETKIATIDLEKIVRLHPNTASDKKLLQKTLQDYQAEAEALEAAALAARKAFDGAAENMRNPALGEKARKAAEEDAKQKYEAARAAERAFLEKKQGLQRSLTDQEVRMLRRTVEEIEGVVADYAKANGISVVLPTTGAKLGISPAVLWAETSLDITSEILAKMKIEDKPVEDADDAAEGKAAGGAAPAAPAAEAKK